MLKKKTCLILGAGASVHLGFPLGADLKTKILARLEKCIESPPALGLLTGEASEKLTKGLDLMQFWEELAYGKWASPDAYLEHHPEFVPLGKFLIYDILSKLESKSTMGSSEGWYWNLIDSIHVTDPDQLRDVGLSIVTFNYDRSIDFRLHKYIERHFRMDSGDALQLRQDAIPIVHVHGSLGAYPNHQYGPPLKTPCPAGASFKVGDLGAEWKTHDDKKIANSQQIKIISEVEDETPEFQIASKLLNEAERVVVFGFAFAEDNVRRLNYFNECDDESRDIRIASGPPSHEPVKARKNEWLARWGLKEGRNIQHQTCNNYFDVVGNPLTDD